MRDHAKRFGIESRSPWEVDLIADEEAAPAHTSDQVIGDVNTPLVFSATEEQVGKVLLGVLDRAAYRTGRRAAEAA